MNDAATAKQLTRAELDILEERRRQITQEGWTEAHDDAHGADELSTAALCYLSAVVYPDEDAWTHAEQKAPGDWPWEAAWWKPTTPRRDLVKATALLIAEIERRDRKEGGA